MNVLILAGGEGLRLRPYTTVLPKPLMPLGDKPIMERLLIQLKQYNFHKIFVSVGYLAPLIQAYFGDGNKWGVEIIYINEDKPLGTAGPISLLPDFEEPLLVLNGDLVTNLNFSEIFNFHIQKNAILTIGVHKLNYKLPLGFLEINNSAEIIDYIEKPEKTYNMSMGIYVCSLKSRKYIKKNEHMDFPVFTKKIIQSGEKVMGYYNNAQWIDVGRPDEYDRAIEMFGEQNSS
ncbi:MAG: nucleoside-diphosphate-sugar pyrophosphorylase [Ignavibacteria bacterium RIFOXYA12_FULL_35_25]|nr:MAG: nucleoside-diphosphate-sugar pyrophosphorylase [Ignavibacteria bacterium GWF2_35_20]OGU85754.1 MAG: nucleoside-diphosphate-sugar pyrophosphorylase [Ignavibacteria bacterium RIFOXYA12_FULL_35_25]OGV31056.1 MAG: nucleoside-diphosphate-sugar pyrophosphorylase [Ignavibacteria bacterium RIFOXYD12_FULL_36_8]